MASIMEFFLAFRRLSPEEMQAVERFRGAITKEEGEHLVRLVKLRRAKIAQKSIDLLYRKADITFAEPLADSCKSFIGSVNEKMLDSERSRVREELKENAYEIIPRFIAGNIVGLDSVKKAAALLLFSSERLHILLLGDPGTGKTDILRSVNALALISTFGLGSGTSGCGLAVTMQGENAIKGLLPLADKGIACIDELNLMEKKDSASLYNAMEKGFVAYDKGGKHIKFDADVRVIATANPEGDSFGGDDVATLKRQLPFEPALLSRFHLVFIIKKPGIESFRQISKDIVSAKKSAPSEEAMGLMRDYVVKASSIEPIIPKELEGEISDFCAWLKKSEGSFIVDISPRTVVGFMRMAKASARIEMRSTVQKSDIKRVKQLFLDSLKVG